MFDFQKLEVYKKALLLHNELKPILKSPGINKNIADQLFRASLSITLNIAEGSGRFTQKDRRNFFIISRSSVFECVAILDVVSSDNCCSNEQYLHLISSADEISRMLYTMIKNLEK
ncbi:MAG: four helix bundle protein [Saprospiraceae bacterium]|nr:four helix bundle protein [Saprospiraceae bacterium]MBK7812755.1 four helix bundle protein [Saprospiraceae bacterium]MBK9630946.1 four helix bundle protein [Saprospiraceae bacterium]